MARKLIIGGEQRFTSGHPCPICNGHKDLPQGVGERCAGFLSSDGRYAHCTREEHAGSLPPNGSSTPATYAHLLDGDCRCGLPHGARSNGQVAGQTSRKASPAQSTGATRGLEWFAEHTGIPLKFLRTLPAYEDGDAVVFTFESLAAEKRRTEEKKGEWRGHAIIPPLWPMPGETLPSNVHIAEGESDCCTLLHAGFEAFAVTTGASSDLDRELFRELARRGVERVVLVGDVDEAGQTWSRRQVRIAQGAQLDAAIVDLRPLVSPFGSDVKDANDLFRSCDSLKQFRTLIEEHTEDVPAPVDETLDLTSFLEIAEREIPWLIRDLIAEGEIVLVAAPQKTYKTWFVLVLIRALTTGGDFLQEGWRATGKHSVLVVEEEGNEVKFAQRLRTANFAGGADVRFRKGSDLTDEGFVDALIAQIREREYHVLVLDPLQRMAPGVNENDAGEMGLLWDSIHRIARECPWVAIVLVHHFNKSAELGWRGIRGSSRTGGEVDVAFFLERQDGGGIKLAIDGRDIPNYLDATEALAVSVEIDSDARVLEMSVEGKVQIKVKAVSKVRAAIEECLRNAAEPITTTDLLRAIAEVLGREVTRQAVSRHLNDLERAGCVAGVATDDPRGTKGWTWVS